MVHSKFGVPKTLIKEEGDLVQVQITFFNFRTKIPQSQALSSKNNSFISNHKIYATNPTG